MILLPARTFEGTFRLPGDKSISHRAAIFAALARGTSTLTGFATGADCASTLSCLRQLGVELERDGDTVEVVGGGVDGLRHCPDDLDCGNSGSTLRMLAGVLAGRPFRSVLTGDESLRRRPMERVAAPLRTMGATIDTTLGKSPVTIDGGKLRGGHHDLPVASAQVKTAVLLAGLQADGPVRVREPHPSRDHTERLLPVFGADVWRENDWTCLKPGPLDAADVAIPGDASSAAFLAVAGLIRPGTAVRMEGVLLSPTRLGFLDVLRAMGADVRVTTTAHEPELVGTIEVRASELRGLEVRPEQVPALVDEVPILAVAATQARGEWQITGASELRVKESDRIAALVEGLTRMGADVTELPDGLVVRGGRPLRGAAVRTHGDHRIAMALAVAALAADGPVTLDDPACVGISFPSFFDLLDTGACR